MYYDDPNPVAHLDRQQKTVVEYGCPYEEGGCTFPRVPAAREDAKAIIRDHINTHMKARPYKCAECDRDYTMERYLKRHVTMAHPKKKSRSHRQPKDTLRPSDAAFLAFRSELSQRFKGDDISNMAGELWKKMSSEEKQVYMDKVSVQSARDNRGASSSASGVNQHAGQESQFRHPQIYNVFPSPLGHPVLSETDPYHASAPSSYQFTPF